MEVIRPYRAYPEMGATCSVSVARTFFTVTNIILSVTGLTILGLGLSVKINFGIFGWFILPILSDVGSADAMDIHNVIVGVGLGFIIVGPVVFCLSIIGCFIAMNKQNMTFMLSYAALIGCVIIGDIVIIAFATSINGKLENNLKEILLKSIEMDYKDSNNTATIRGPWNYVFAFLDCCGVTNYKDLYTAIHWDRTIVVHGVTRNVTTPLSCCSNVTSFLQLPDPHCAISPTNKTNNWNTGCYDRVKGLLQYTSEMYETMGWVTVLLLVVILMELFFLYKAQHPQIPDPPPPYPDVTREDMPYRLPNYPNANAMFCPTSNPINTYPVSPTGHPIYPTAYPVPPAGNSVYPTTNVIHAK